MEQQKPKAPYSSKDYVPFEWKTINKELFEKAVEAAKESGIKNEDILNQTAFQLYNSMLLQKSVDRIKIITGFWSLILLVGLFASILGLT